MHVSKLSPFARAGLSLSATVVARPKSDRGVALDGSTAAMLSLLERSGRPTLEELGPERARAEGELLSAFADVAPEPVARIEERFAPGPSGADIPVHLYYPRRLGRLPITVFFHGGGFVVGNPRTYDGLCRFLANRSGAVVASVDYRLAPEHPFPAGVDDALEAFRWVAENAEKLGGDSQRLAVAGDSAGGNLAALVSLATREDEIRPRLQLLFYPATELTRSQPSHRRFARGFFLTEAMMDFFLAAYLRDPAEAEDPRASPLLAPSLEGAPEAHVITAGFDPLRDEGEAYAHRLREAGVPTTLTCHESLIHGFASMGGLIPAARHAIEDAADMLARRL